MITQCTVHNGNNTTFTFISNGGGGGGSKDTYAGNGGSGGGGGCNSDMYNHVVHLVRVITVVNGGNH